MRPARCYQEAVVFAEGELEGFPLGKGQSTLQFTIFELVDQDLQLAADRGELTRR